MAKGKETTKRRAATEGISDSGARKDVQLKSAHLILFAQTLSVAASIFGLLGLFIAYRLLVTSDDTENPTDVPTIS